MRERGVRVVGEDCFLLLFSFALVSFLFRVGFKFVLVSSISASSTVFVMFHFSPLLQFPVLVSS